MILFFTGTGNSKYVADFISDRIGEQSVNLFEKIKNKDYTEINSATPFVICAPTYSWQIPHIVRDWLLNAKLTGSDKIYFVMSCGGEIGNAEKYLKSLSARINKQYMGCAEILMPENYIALFSSPTKDEAESIIASADKKLEQVSDAIKLGEVLDNNKVGLVDRLYSSVVNTLFYPVCVKDKKFTVSDECIGCGICAKKCVMNNIKLINNKPQWQGDCTHCMACINYCPKEAIEYGEHSKGQPRYTCKEYKK